MASVSILLLWILLTSGLSAEQSVTWNSTGLPDNVTIPTCPEQNVTLSWQYVVNDPAAHVLNIEWRYTPNGSEEVLATQVMGNFFASPTATTHMQFMPNAGIRLLHVAAADSGTYSVHVNLNIHGSIVTEVQTAHVVVSDAPITESGGLDIRMEAGTEYLNTDNQSHVVLSCGTFKSVWDSRVNVVWKTSEDKGTIPSTWHRDGRFYLALPNPVTSTNYTCSLDPASPAAVCVRQHHVSLKASILVDGQQARFALLEGQLMTLTAANGAMQQRLDALEAENTHLKQQVETLTNQTANLTSAAGTPSASQPMVFFQAHIRTHKTASDNPLLYDTVDSNEGKAFSELTGTFTAPVAGLYAFFITVNSASDSAAVQVNLYVAGHVVAIARAVYNTTGSNRALVRMSAGETALVKITEGQLENGNFCTFSGVLLLQA